MKTDMCVAISWYFLSLERIMHTDDFDDRLRKRRKER